MRRSALLSFSLIILLSISETFSEINDEQHTLSFAENLYINLSGACRAMMNLRYNTMKGNSDDILNTMKIIYLDKHNVRTFSIDEAYVSLTKQQLFDITKQSKIVIHGWRDSAESAKPHDLALAYNEKNMFNVLLVDAEQLLENHYLQSVHNARLVGKRLANLLANLENYGANAEDFHLLGISLGAHIAGWAGKYFYQYKGHRLGRITGLDPAGPCFSSAFSDQRLDKSDAAYVDVVHSNRLVQGVIESVGDADYYVNGGGPHQPGCLMPSCSHLRAAEVFTESVRLPKTFVGVKCKSKKDWMTGACATDDISILGYGSSLSSRGDYYLRTASQAPFGLGMDGTRYDAQSLDLIKLNFT